MRKGPSHIVGALRTVAINILTRIAYGRDTPDHSSFASGDTHMDLSYVDAITVCTEQLLAAAFVPAKVLRLPVMPRSLQKLGRALTHLPRLTSDTLDQERKKNIHAAPASSQMNPNTIMTTLVRLSDQAREQDQSGGKASFSSNDKGTAGNSTSAIKSYLTEDEIAGNLFIFTAAGFETTSNTLSYAVTLLAAYPKWQSWIQEEIDLVLGTSGLDQGEQRPLQDYATVSPKLMRCKALMVRCNTLFLLLLADHDFMSLLPT